MTNTPLRAAFWSLLAACGLLAAAASTNPHEVHLAMATPPGTTLDPNGLDIMLAGADASDELPHSVIAPGDIPTAAGLPQPGPLQLGDPEPFAPQLAAVDPQPAGPDAEMSAVVPTLASPSTGASDPFAIAAGDPGPIRVASQGGTLQLELDAAARLPSPERRSVSAPPRWNGAEPEVERIVPMPMDLLPTLAAARSEPVADPAPTAEPEPMLTDATRNKPAATSDSRPLQLAQVTTGRGGAKSSTPTLPPAPQPAPQSDAHSIQSAAAEADFDRSLFPGDAGNGPDRLVPDVMPLQVAQLDLLNQLKELQQASQQRGQAIRKAKSNATGGGSGRSAGGSIEDELFGDDTEEEAEVEVQPEFEPTGRNADGEPIFSLQIADAKLPQVLEMIGDIGGLNIVLADPVEVSVPNNLYDVSVDEALDALGRGFGLEYDRVGRFLHVNTRLAADERREKARKRISKVYRPGFVAVRDLEQLVTPLLTPGIGVVSVSTPAETGIAASNSEAGGDSLAQPDALVVIDYAEKIEEIDELVRQMDIAPPQVAIDAAIMQVRLTDQLNLGVNFALAGGGNNDLLISGNGAAINGSAGLPLPLAPDTPGPDSIIEPLGRFVAGQAGLSFGYLRGDLSALVSALEEITDVSVLATPHVQVVNKQKAELIQGTRLGYKTFSFNNTQTIENIQFLDAGTKLLLRPFVGSNGLIRLEVHPERSSAQINPISGLPQQQTTEVTTNVLVRDGETLVIGGLIEEETISDTQQIPVLGSIPVIGRAFRNTAEQQIRTELVIVITPRLVRQDDAYRSAALAGDFAARAEEFHEQLTPVMRTRLADLHRRKAEEALAVGDQLEALHQIEKTLYLNPGDLRALRIRDSITGRW